MWILLTDNYQLLQKKWSIFTIIGSIQSRVLLSSHINTPNKCTRLLLFSFIQAFYRENMMHSSLSRTLLLDQLKTLIGMSLFEFKNQFTILFLNRWNSCWCWNVRLWKNILLKKKVCSIWVKCIHQNHNVLMIWMTKTLMFHLFIWSWSEILKFYLCMLIAFNFDFSNDIFTH